MKKSNRMASYGSDYGIYPFYTSSNKVLWCDTADYKKVCLIIGTGGNANIKYDSNFSCSSDNIVIKSSNLKIVKTKYIYYYFLTHMDILEKGFAGSTIKHISKKYIQEIEIPLLPINTQKNIIEKLDVLSNNILKSKEMIMQYQSIIKFYVENSGGKEYNLKEICDINPETIKKGYTFINYIDIGSVHNGKLNGIKKLTKNFPSRAKRLIRKDDILLSTVRPNLKNYLFLDKDINNGVCSTGFCVIRSKNKDKFLPKIIYYQIQSDDVTNYLVTNATGSQYPAVNCATVSNIKIKIPSKEKQQEIITYADNLNKIIVAIEQQIVHNKYLMREIVDSYLKSFDN